MHRCLGVLLGLGLPFSALAKNDRLLPEGQGLGSYRRSSLPRETPPPPRDDLGSWASDSTGWQVGDAEEQELPKIPQNHRPRAGSEGQRPAPRKTLKEEIAARIPPQASSSGLSALEKLVQRKQGNLSFGATDTPEPASSIPHSPHQAALKDPDFPGLGNLHPRNPKYRRWSRKYRSSARWVRSHRSEAESLLRGEAPSPGGSPPASSEAPLSESPPTPRARAERAPAPRSPSPTRGRAPEPRRILAQAPEPRPPTRPEPSTWAEADPQPKIPRRRSSPARKEESPAESKSFEGPRIQYFSNGRTQRSPAARVQPRTTPASQDRDPFGVEVSAAELSREAPDPYRRWAPPERAAAGRDYYSQPRPVDPHARRARARPHRVRVRERKY